MPGLPMSTGEPVAATSAATSAAATSGATSAAATSATTSAAATSAAASGPSKPNNTREVEFQAEDACSFSVMVLLVLVAVTFPVSVFYCFKVMNEYERAVIFRQGRLRAGGARGPGTFFILPCIDVYTKVDMRIVSFKIPPQEILTKDSVSVTVDAVVYYRIREPMKAIVRVEDPDASTKLIAASTLRNVLGTKDLAEMLSEREAINETVKSILEEATGPWGVDVERVEMKDLRLPEALQKAMGAEAQAGRETKAKIITAEGEIQASRALKEASMVMSDDPMAMQLRNLQAMTSMSADHESMIIFPFPLDFTQTFLAGMP